MEQCYYYKSFVAHPNLFYDSNINLLLVYVCSKLLLFSYLRVSANVLRLKKVGDFEAQTFF
jgi:hypothetical protein